MTGKRFTYQCDGNGLYHSKNTGPGICLIADGTQLSDLRLADGSHKNIGIPTEEMPVVVNVMEMKHIIIHAQ